MRIPKMKTENRVAVQTGAGFIVGALLTPMITKKDAKAKDYVKYLTLCTLFGMGIGLIGSGVDIHKEGDTLKVNIDPLYN